MIYYFLVILAVTKWIFHQWNSTSSAIGYGYLIYKHQVHTQSLVSWYQPTGDQGKQGQFKLDHQVLQETELIIGSIIVIMFVAEAIADFSTETIQPQKEATSHIHQQDHPPSEEEQELATIPKQAEKEKQQIQQKEEGNQQQQEEQEQPQEKQEQGNKKKRKRDPDHEQALADQEDKPSYLEFKTGDKILVKQTDESGWWYGNIIGKTYQGFFPSTFVKCGSKAPLPPAPPEPQSKDWMTEQLDKMHQGPVQSEYYQGIIGHKLVKIDDKNKNLLKANYVKYNQATGLASVPIKSQAPNAKAVRQMGYYFDYHQWIDERNNAPEVRARPDIRRKKQKKLNLKLFGEQKANKKN